MSRRTKGILCIIAAAACWTVMNAFVRLAGDLPSPEKSFFRNLVAVFVALAILLKERKTIAPPPKQAWLPLLLRSVCGTIGILCNYYAVDHLILADASMLNKLSPFFAVVFSAALTRETPKPVQAVAIFVAFAGSFFIVKPTFANADLMASVIGLAGGIAAGAAYAFVRKLGNMGVAGCIIVFVFSAFSCITMIPYLAVAYVPISPYQLAMLLLAGLAAAGGQFTVTAAYTYAPASEVSVYDYSQIIFSALLGWFLFADVPDRWSVLGYVVIVAMGVWMFLYGRKPSPGKNKR